MDLKTLGEDSLKHFLKALHKLIITDKRKFDMLVSAGNSGQIMLWITKKVYDFFVIPLPLTIVFPLYRYKNFPKKILFDNSEVVKDYTHVQIPKESKYILYVDDEIERGNAAEATYKIVNSLSSGNNFIYTILAEDGGFQPEKLQYAQIEYISPKKRVDGVYNAISHAIPKKFQDPIQSILENEITSLNDKKIMCILLDLPVKELSNGKPEFNDRLATIVKKQLPSLAVLQNEYQKYLSNTINGILGDK